MDTAVYGYGDKLYLNITNKCHLDCTFCIRRNKMCIRDRGCRAKKGGKEYDKMDREKTFGPDGPVGRGSGPGSGTAAAQRAAKPVALLWVCLLYTSGPVGLMAVAGAKLRGASHLYAVGSRPDCAALAREYGATEIINYREGDIVKQIMELTHGKGVDRVIVAGGNAEETFAQAITMLKPGGRSGNVNYLGSGDYVKMCIRDSFLSYFKEQRWLVQS